MKKKNFVTLLMSTVGGILFALGMCMVLLTEWNVMKQGIVIGAAGAIILLAMLLIRRKMDGKPAIAWSAKPSVLPCWGWPEHLYWESVCA